MSKCQFCCQDRGSGGRHLTHRRLLSPANHVWGQEPAIRLHPVQNGQSWWQRCPHLYSWLPVVLLGTETDLWAESVFVILTLTLKSDWLSYFKWFAGSGFVCGLQAAHLCDPNQTSSGLPGRLRRVFGGSVQPAQTALNQSGCSAHLKTVTPEC